MLNFLARQLPRAPQAAMPNLAIDPLRLLAMLSGFGALALFVMLWRWGGTIEDSQAYFDTARYFNGEIEKSALRAPFPYRLLMPALASLMPGDLRNGFALLNWLSMAGAAFMICWMLLRLGFGWKRAAAGGLLLIVSVPTFWYAPYLLVDPGSIFARAVFVLGVLCGQPWVALAAGLAGSAVREENILLLAWLVAARQVGWRAGLLALCAAGAWIVAVRWYLIPDLPGYVWEPSLWTVTQALQDKRSLASLAAAASIVLPLALLGMRRSLALLAPLKSLLLLMALPPLYAALCVRVDGRAIWGLYPMLIPFAVAVGMRARAPAKEI